MRSSECDHDRTFSKVWLRVKVVLVFLAVSQGLPARTSVPPSDSHARDHHFISFPVMILVVAAYALLVGISLPDLPEADSCYRTW